MTTGHYEYLVMPFRLSNSPSVFQAYIKDVFRDMLNRWVIVYIDDIQIYSDSLETHVQHVRAFLNSLVEHQLYAKKEKCEFHQTLVSFLGYIISAGGVAMDINKVQSVLNWSQPTTVKELQWFLGFANFYRRFISNFSTIAAPLISLLRGGRQHLNWSPSAQNAVQQLKDRFTTAPIPHHPDPNLGWRFQHWHLSHPISTSWQSSQAIPMCLLLMQIEFCRDKLWHWRPWVAGDEGSLWRMVTLARGC